RNGRDGCGMRDASAARWMRLLAGCPQSKKKPIPFRKAIVALSGLERRGYKVGASLLPFDEESIMRSILSPPPSNRHSTAPVGQCAILCSVGGQFVKCGCHRLSSLRF